MSSTENTKAAGTGIIPVPVILDTDIGNDPDDMLALAMILDRPEFDLRAVFTTGAAPGLRAVLARHLCRVAGRDIPIGVGEVPPGYDEPVRFHVGYFERQGAVLSDAHKFPPANEVFSGLKVYGEERITLITIGPLTTTASLVKSYPDWSEKIGKIVSMGGFISLWEKNRYLREHNFSSDVGSAFGVLAHSEFDHVCVTKNVCQGLIMKAEDVPRLNTSGSPARNWAFGFMREWFVNREKKLLHDPLTAVAAIDPGPLKFKPVRFNVREDGKIRGEIDEYSHCQAAIGGFPKADVSWFNQYFYG